MKKILAVLVLAGGVLPAVGCATTVAGGPDFVPVNSQPAGATVKLDGIQVGKTPLIIPFDRHCEGVLTFELEGYESRTVDLDKVANGWFFGNLLWFPIWPVVPVGMIVDLCTSNQGKYSTAPIQVVLQPTPLRKNGSAP